MSKETNTDISSFTSVLIPQEKLRNTHGMQGHHLKNCGGRVIKAEYVIWKYRWISDRLPRALSQVAWKRVRVFHSTVLRLETKDPVISVCHVPTVRFSLSYSKTYSWIDLHPGGPWLGSRPRVNITRASNYPAGVDMWQLALSSIYLLKQVSLFKYTCGHLCTCGCDGHWMRCGLICCYLEAKKSNVSCKSVSQYCAILKSSLFT